MSDEPERPSPPPQTARLCPDCKRMKDDTGETYGWGLCSCGSFRYPGRRNEGCEICGDPNHDGGAHL